MSKSRNPTPTRNLPDTTTSTPGVPRTGDEPTTRTSPHDANTALQESLNEQRTQRTPTTSTMRTMVHDPSNNPRSPISRGVVRPAQHDIEQPTSKRIRTKSTGSPERSGALASPSSDSQGAMADSEAESKPGGEQSQPPPKKKRTRTLTTPHQAAVLHALLAQSRFPTTAMREEVGRSIGLSARKVQIWFQNQRQKARRPRNQGDASSNRPPQFGPYPIGTSTGATAGSYPAMTGVIGPYPHASTSRAAERAEPHADPFRHHSVPLPSSGADDTPRLLGPGMPGTELYGHSRTSRGTEWPLSAPPTEGQFSTGSRLRYDSPPPPTLSPAYPATRPTTSQSRGWRERDLESRTLPPLIPSRPSTASSLGLRHSFPLEPVPSHYPTISSILGRRSVSPETRFAHQPPDTLPSRSGLSIPPPFTLQPAPQWDNSAFSRPSSSWSRPASRSSDKRSISPPSSRLPEISRPLDSSPLRHDFHDFSRGGTPQPRSPPPTGRRPLSPPPPPPGRYDPIREIFVPFTKPSSPATQSPSQLTQGEENSLEPSEEKL